MDNRVISPRTWLPFQEIAEVAKFRDLEFWHCRLPYSTTCSF